MKLNEAIKTARESKKISQRELGRRINKTGQYISYLEKEENSNPSIDVLQKIAEVLEVPLMQLMGVAPIGKTFINEEQQITHVLARKNDNIPPEEAKMMIYPYINCIADKEGYIVGSGSEYEDIVDSVDDLIRGKILRLIEKRGKEIK